jgi:hypothetical protein
MRRKWKLLLIVSLTVVIGVVVAFRIFDSSSSVLSQVLHLERLPSSIRHLRMGSDVGTDEVRGFYFEIAPNEFPALLAGREFRPIDSGGTFEAHTIHVFPSVSFLARWLYVWDSPHAQCKITTNEEKTRVIVLFSAD